MRAAVSSALGSCFVSSFTVASDFHQGAKVGQVKIFDGATSSVPARIRVEEATTVTSGRIFSPAYRDLTAGISGAATLSATRSVYLTLTRTSGSGNLSALTGDVIKVHVVRGTLQ